MSGNYVVGGARSAAALFFAGVFSLLPAHHSLSASLQAVAGFGPNPGRLDMYIYVPDDPQPLATLVVALHGCRQRAADFDDETGLTALADALNFVLLFPEQRAENNAQRCFNWFDERHNKRRLGESGSIRSMIQHLIVTGQVDASSIFVLGLSAGGSMTAVLMANYPALFRGGAVVAGTPYGCNRPTFLTWAWWWFLDVWYGKAAAASYACGLFNQAPTQRSPSVWGDFVRASSGAVPSHWPRISLWQGGADTVVNPANQVELVKQWTNVLGIDAIPDQVDVVNGIMHGVYRDAGGVGRLETYAIAGFGHAFAVDPGTGPTQCGTVAPYVEDADICSALKILEFWGLAP